MVLEIDGYKVVDWSHGQLTISVADVDDVPNERLIAELNRFSEQHNIGYYASDLWGEIMIECSRPGLSLAAVLEWDNDYSVSVAV